ncbi:hypothetical protein GCM10022402_19160 [Salinactinospora qingdaonensis]|uniref:Uncharacterized protein n=2 Tax=Salinactinospora qingdaonensis TaxID=702744 RepID=A0ABP7FHG6_9ACTN
MPPRDQGALWVEEKAPEWRCVWLPRHGTYLAYRDMEMANPSAPKPAVAEPKPDEVLRAIELIADLRELVWAWVYRRV